MCLAVPMRVKSIGESGTATVEFGGIRKKVNIQLLNDVKNGEYLLIHAGVAIEKVDEKEAERMLQLLGTLQR
jgi:hydrogenase expression/formation protein HypC